jgi:hypothetical protein
MHSVFELSFYLRKAKPFEFFDILARELALL